MVKNKFISIVGDIAICVAVLMLCVAGVFNVFERKKLENKLDVVNAQVEEILIENEQLKSIASQTDAELQSMDKKIDSTQDVLSNTNRALIRINKQIQNSTEEKPKEISKEVNTVTETYMAYDDTPVVAEEPEVEVSEVEVAEEAEPQPRSGYLGQFEITAYSWTGNPCADGVMPQEGVTAASNDPSLWHQWIYVDGIGDVYIHDTGGMGMGVIDIYMPSESDCIEWGRQTRDVYYSE